MSNTHVREAEQADAVSLAAIYNTAAGKFTLDLVRRDSGWFEEMMREMGPRERILVLSAARDAEDILGFGLLRRYSWKEGYHHAGQTSVFFRPDARGYGYGTVLKRNLIDLARALHYRQLVARVMADNQASIMYNRRLGYEMVGIQRRILGKQTAYHGQLQPVDGRA